MPSSGAFSYGSEHTNCVTSDPGTFHDKRKDAGMSDLLTLDLHGVQSNVHSLAPRRRAGREATRLMPARSGWEGRRAPSPRPSDRLQPQTPPSLSFRRKLPRLPACPIIPETAKIPLHEDTFSDEQEHDLEHAWPKQRSHR